MKRRSIRVQSMQASLQLQLLQHKMTEMDDSELLKDDMLRQYVPPVGTILWFISLGEFCIHTVIMTMLYHSPVGQNWHLRNLWLCNRYFLSIDSDFVFAFRCLFMFQVVVCVDFWFPLNTTSPHLLHLYTIL